MIQTILLFTLRPGVTDEQIEALRAGLAAIPFEGRYNMRLGRDIGLLDGAMDLAIVADYDDEDTYRRWFGHPEHARVRDELLAPSSTAGNAARSGSEPGQVPCGRRGAPGTGRSYGVDVPAMPLDHGACCRGAEARGPRGKLSSL